MKRFLFLTAIFILLLASSACSVARPARCESATTTEVTQMAATSDSTRSDSFSAFRASLDVEMEDVRIDYYIPTHRRDSTAMAGDSVRASPAGHRPNLPPRLMASVSIGRVQTSATGAGESKTVTDRLTIAETSATMTTATDAATVPQSTGWDLLCRIFLVMCFAAGITAGMTMLRRNDS